jgi:hypothetical protein
MITFQACFRSGIAIGISGLLFVVGCRSASVNTSRPIPGMSGGPSYYRSYGKPAPSYDDQDAEQSQPPSPEPPSVLPAPGYSEPPTPSAKKSRWNLNNAGLKFPSFTRMNSEVRQTGVNSERTVPKTIDKSESAAPKSQTAEVEEEVVQSRSTSRMNTPKLSSKVLPFSAPSTSSPDGSVGEMPLLLPPGH